MNGIEQNYTFALRASTKNPSLIQLPYGARCVFNSIGILSFMRNSFQRDVQITIPAQVGGKSCEFLIGDGRQWNIAIKRGVKRIKECS